jgi:hypothetical protein
MLQTNTIERVPVMFPGRLISLVVNDLSALLQPELEHAEYFSPQNRHDYSPRNFPDKMDWFRPAIFMVRGGSEGYYVHFDLIDMDNKSLIHPDTESNFLSVYCQKLIPVALAKFLGDVRHPLAFCNALTKIVVDDMYRY